jgi:hypothetical protein
MSSASSHAADQQAAAARNAQAIQQQQFQVGRDALNPYINAGQGVLGTLAGLETPGSNQTALLSQMPGFQFQSQWGDMAAQNALAAQGLAGSAGPVGTALSNYNQGLAGTYYMNSINALQNTANMGANASGSLMGNAVASGNSQGNAALAVGNANASGTLGSANAISGGLGSIGNSLLMNSILNRGSAGGLYAPGSDPSSAAAASLGGAIY